MPSSRITKQSIQSPGNIDSVRISLANSLLSSLNWLDNTYPIAEIIRSREGGQIYASYSGKNEYVNLMPNGTKGCYAFIYLRSFSTVQNGPQFGGLIGSDQLDIDLNIFFDYRKVRPGDEDIVTSNNVYDEVKEAVFTSQKSGLSFEVNSAVDDPEAVFQPASINLSDPKLMRRPFGALSLNISAVANDIFYCNYVNRCN